MAKYKITIPGGVYFLEGEDKRALIKEAISKFRDELDKSIFDETIFKIPDVCREVGAEYVPPLLIKRKRR